MEEEVGIFGNFTRLFKVYVSTYFQFYFTEQENAFGSHYRADSDFWIFSYPD